MRQNVFDYHLLKRGIFDEKWYLAKYPDVAAAGLDPVKHYLSCGAMEGRDPNPFFSTTKYLAANPDLVNSHRNPLAHYRQAGAFEGRIGVHRMPQSINSIVFSRLDGQDGSLGSRSHSRKFTTELRTA
jgi:hypothetical protein